jgi:hypothetical protein
VKKFDLADFLNELAALTPIVRWGDKIARGSEFHIQVQAVFKSGNGLESAARLRVEFEININRLRPKAKQEGRGPAGQINFARSLCGIGKVPHELAQSLNGNASTHLRRKFG